MENFVKELLRDNRRMRFTWSMAYYVIHFLLGSSALYLALLHVDAPFSGDAALLRPFAAAGVDESTMLGSLVALPVAMGIAAYSAYSRSLRLLAAAALSLLWPLQALLRAIAGSAMLRNWWPAWFAALVPILVIAAQAFAESQFEEQERLVLNAFDKAMATLKQRADKAAEEAAAAAKARGGAVKRK
jgi:hypothetical protein